MARRAPEPQADGLRAQNKQDKLERIQKAAVKLFRKQGFGATTTRQIAQEAGVAAGTVFLYAPSKEALLFLAFAEGVDHALASRQPTLPRAGLKAQLQHLLGAVLEHYARDLALSRVFVKELLFFDVAQAPQGMDHGMAFVGQVAKLVEAAQARSELRAEVAPLQLATNCFSLYLGVVVGFLGGALPSLDAAHAALDAALQLQLGPLTPPKPVKKATKRAAKGGSHARRV